MLVGIHQNFYDMLFTQSCPCFLKSFLFQHYNKPSRQGDICSCGGPLYAYYVTSMYFSLHECVSPASTLNWVRRGSRKHPITFSIIECVFSYRRVHEKKKKKKTQIDWAWTCSHFSFCQASVFVLWFSALSWRRAATTHRSASVLSTNQDLFMKQRSSKTRGRAANTTRYY